MSKILITLDLSKVSKNKVVPREYVNKDNVTVKTKDYKIEVVELKEPKLLKEGDGWRLFKTHFVAEEQTREERDAKAPTVYVGSGVTFEGKSKSEEEDDLWGSI